MGEKETASRVFPETNIAADDPEAAEGIVKSKSNITNNREDEPSARLQMPPAGAEPAEATNLNSSKSNRESGPPGSEPTEASNLNLSKSNRDSGPPGSEPTEASNLNLSKSNRDSAPPGSEPTESANLNLSKTN